MKVKVVKAYNDFSLGYRVPANTELEVTEARAKQLLKAGVIATPPTTGKSGKSGRKKES